jgi:hypothetical protein
MNKPPAAAAAAATAPTNPARLRFEFFFFAMIQPCLGRGFTVPGRPVLGRRITRHPLSMEAHVTGSPHKIREIQACMQF